jgi:hypothetical protein
VSARPTNTPATSEPETCGGAVSAETLEAIARCLQGLSYGQLVIQIHDGAVVQIERTEKIRPARR